MATPIKPKRTFTADKVPTTADLQDGEMGINVPDGRIYVRQGSEIKVVASKEQGTVKSISAPAIPLGQFGVNVNADDPENPVISLSGFIPQGQVYSSPELLSGPPTFRALVASDIPQLHPSKISGGILSNSVIPWSQDYINGFQISTTDTTIVIGPGVAYIPSLNTVLESSGTTISSSRAASTNYHLYLNSNGTITRVTTSPGAPYYLTARRQGTNNNTRYLGTVTTDGSGNYIRQSMIPGTNVVQVAFLNNTSGNILLSNGSSLTTTDVSAASWAPTTSTALRLRIQESSTTSAGLLRIYAWDGSSMSLWSNLPFASTYVVHDVPCDSTPKIRYDVTNSGRQAFIMIMGYTYER